MLSTQPRGTYTLIYSKHCGRKRGIGGNYTLVLWLEHENTSHSNKRVNFATIVISQAVKSFAQSCGGAGILLGLSVKEGGGGVGGGLCYGGLLDWNWEIKDLNNKQTSHCLAESL